ncbi:MAG: glycosyltransferase family 29 protein [Thiobacillus sp.]|nr:glycosyltransferase family 29 protein [Thiobacillus sp.]
MAGRTSELGLSGWPLRQCREWAARRRHDGQYDFATLAGFREAWRKSRQAGDLVAYLAFRRDLGLPLHRHHLPLLLAVLPRLGPRAWLEAFNLIEEAMGRGHPPPIHLGPLKRRLCEVSPPLAALLADSAFVRKSPFLSAMARLDREQEVRRAAFAAHLRSVPSLCVVGNHSGLIGSGLGAAIDAHACVVRFNQYRGPGSDLADLGERTDVWVRMPGVAREQIDFRGGWVVISGPDLRYRLSNWHAARDLLERNVPMLTVPLDVWRDLVAELAAPPSAGLLFLAWLRRLLPHGLRGVGLAGFQRASDKEGAYHHAVVGKQAGHRHDWPLERALLEDWTQEGGARWLARS